MSGPTPLGGFNCSADEPLLATMFRFSALSDLFCTKWFSVLENPNPTPGPPSAMPLPGYLSGFGRAEVLSGCKCYVEELTVSELPNLVLSTSLLSVSSMPTIIMDPPTPLSSVPGVVFQPTMTTTTSSAFNNSSANSPQSQDDVTSTTEEESGSTKLVPFFVLLPLAVITGVLLLVCMYSFC